jgi:tetratricopeptide (TPR) repeat protein
MVVLDGARRAFNDGQYPAAADRFREFLNLYGNHREAPAAHYGLGLALLEGPAKDYGQAANSLRQVAARPDFPDRGLALYYLGVALRGMGYQVLEKAAASPPKEAEGLQSAARGHFDEASRSFAGAADAFAARVKAPPPPEAPLPPDLQWAARARADRDEMLLRAERFKEAAELAEAFLADPVMARSGYADLEVYHLGHARFGLKDYLAAGRALSRLAPFQQPFGGHVRYLLARTHHLAGERPEAVALYQAVQDDWQARRKAAEEALKRKGAVRPEQRAVLEALVNRPPEYVVRASLYGALLMAEAGDFGPALERLFALVQRYPDWPLAAEARLRVGYLRLQLRNFPQAIEALAPLLEHPQLADQALWWTALAQIGAADPNNAAARGEALRAAAETLRRAADAAGKLATRDAEARVRRGDILLDLGDTLVLADRPREAAAVYQQAINEGGNPDRREEATQRLAAALHLDGRYRESDDVCRRFEQTWPQSPLMGSVVFRSAENAYWTAVAADRDPKTADRERALPPLYQEAVRRYRRVLAEYPEFAHAGLARYGLATALYRLGRYGEALEALAAIPEADRTGDLAAAFYLMGDSHIRMFPDETGDALRAARLVDGAGQAAKLLEQFLAAGPQAAEAPDALVKLGFTYERAAAVLAGPAERRKTYALAAQAYERFLKGFGQHPSAAAVLIERARCLALAGDPAAGLADLQRFGAEPLNASPLVPLAMVRWSVILRSMNRAAEAAALMARCRSGHEAALQEDAARRGWVPMIHYEHALAVKESGKTAEARQMFEALAAQFPGRAEATSALWQAARAARELVAAGLAESRRALARPDARPPDIAAARQAVGAGLEALRQGVAALEAQAENVGQAAPGFDAHLRLLYEAAWCHRTIAQAETDAVMDRLRRESLQALQAKLAAESPPRALPQGYVPAEVPLASVPVQASEMAARAQYRRLIGAAPSSPLAAQARLELAEMLIERGDEDGAADLLGEALRTNPPPGLADRLHTRLAACLLARDDLQRARPHIEAASASPSGAAAVEARYLAGEAALRQGDWQKAASLLAAFRDEAPFQNVPGLSDRALDSLGRACAQGGQWDASRQAYEVLVQRFPRSAFADEARYGIGWAHQKQNRHDEAVRAYAEVTRRTVAEVAARAQLQIGLARLEQKRFAEAVSALLVVPYTYAYADLGAAAWCEAGRAHAMASQSAQAARCWQRVVKDYPASPWAQVARLRLSELR